MNKENNKKGTKDLFGTMVEIIMAGVVFVFMWSQSLYTFQFIFPTEKWWMAYLGLGLTGGGMVGYLIILKRKMADTPAKRFIVLSMLVVCTLGEMAAAGFGMKIEAIQKMGASLTPEFIDLMVNTLRGLGLLHAMALIGFFFWDDIAEAWNDRDGDGIPDRRDPIDNRTGKPFRAQPAMSQDVEQPELQDRDFTNRPRPK